MCLHELELQLFKRKPEKEQWKNVTFHNFDSKQTRGIMKISVCRFKSQPYYHHLAATPSFGKADS